MKGYMTEAQILNALEIPDFRHMTKNKVVAFASMLQEMDPEVAKKAIEQFPNFRELTIELLSSYKEASIVLSNNSKEITTQCIEVINGISDSLGRCMSQDNVSTEEKKMYVESIMEIVRTVTEIDASSKEMNTRTQILIGIAVFVLGSIASALLGNTLRLKAS